MGGAARGAARVVAMVAVAMVAARAVVGRAVAMVAATAAAATAAAATAAVVRAVATVEAATAVARVADKAGKVAAGCLEVSQEAPVVLQVEVGLVAATEAEERGVGPGVARAAPG